MISNNFGRLGNGKSFFIYAICCLDRSHFIGNNNIGLERTDAAVGRDGKLA